MVRLEKEIRLLTTKQVNILLHLGLLIILPLIGTTVFNTTKQLVEYYTNGYYIYHCVLANWQYINFTFTDDYLQMCKSTDIGLVIITLVITIPTFIYCANRIRIFILYKNRHKCIDGKYRIIQPFPFDCPVCGYDAYRNKLNEMYFGCDIC